MRTSCPAGSPAPARRTWTLAGNADGPFFGARGGGGVIPLPQGQGVAVTAPGKPEWPPM